MPVQKNIAEYLHYYIGSKCEFGFEGRNKKGLLQGKVEPFGWQVFDLSSAFGIRHNVRSELIKPILRKLEDMTEEEESEWLSARNEARMEHSGKLVHGGCHIAFLDPVSADWLFKHGFDVFCLIESGLAIDEKTVKG